MMKMIGECVRRGHQIKVFTLRWEAPADPNLDVQLVPIVGLSRHAQYEHFADFVNQAVAADSFDLIVGFNKMPGLDVYYAGDSCYIEKALSQRSTWYRWLPRFKSFYRAERAVFDRLSDTEILTISDVEVPRYRVHYRTAPERFHPLPPGIETDRIAPADVSDLRDELRTEFNLPNDHLVLLFIGSGFIKKGLDRALLAVAALPAALRMRLHMFVIGRDKGDAFERMAMRLGITSQVTFLTDGRDDVPRFLFAADALLHPAYDETAGMVIIEAMLAGVPVVVTKNCGYAKFIAEREAGIVLPSPFAQEELDSALEELLTSTERDRWRSNGLAAKNQATLFELVPRAVDYMERFARGSRPLLIFTLFRYFPYGGLQRDFMRIAQACHAKGYDILVYCMAWEGDQPSEFNVITVDAVGLSNHARSVSFADFVAHDAKWRQPAAIVGFNRMPGLDLYYAADSCFEHKARHLRTALYRTTERYRIMASFERAVFGADSSTQVMLIAENQKTQFQTHYETPDERLHFLPPGVSRDRARPNDWSTLRQDIRSELSIGEDEFLLLMIGSGFVTKGLDRLLHAFAALPPRLASCAHLLVIGQDNPRQFLRLADTLEIAERTTIMKGRDDIPALLQGADLMVHPAYMESGGMVLIEAVIAGLPVIASGICGFAHYIDDASAGVVLPEPFAQDDLNQAIVSALDDADQRQRWSANGVRYGQTAEDLYDMPSHALRYIEHTIAQVKVRNRAAFDANEGAMLGDQNAADQPTREVL